MPFVQTLPKHPTDIIGDIHGEIEALTALLSQLGYSEAGNHPQPRSIVFAGDLVDRGPDSPAVMEKVIHLVEAGVAHCLLGNHELNILRGVAKGGNDWILEKNTHAQSSANYQFATRQQREVFLDFLNRQPFVLEGPHLRIVHACWNTPAVQFLQQAQHSKLTVGQFYQQIETDIYNKLEAGPKSELKRREMAQYGDQIIDPDWTAQLLPGHAEVDLALQMNNPLRVLTTSEEKVADKPFWAGGKWRMAERTRWWDHYAEQTPVVIGHFWRLFNNDARRITGMFGPDVFEGTPSHAWMGKNRNVYCVDYSVGQRHLERRQEKPADFHGKLAALRYPEWEVMHDDGSVIPIGSPGL